MRLYLGKLSRAITELKKLLLLPPSSRLLGRTSAPGANSGSGLIERLLLSLVSYAFSENISALAKIIFRDIAPREKIIKLWFFALKRFLKFAIIKNNDYFD